MSPTFPIIAKTLFGLESVLADELRGLGAEQIELGNRLVSFVGDQRMLYRANLWLRTAIRVLKPIASFAIAAEQDLYRGVQQTDWAQYLAIDGSLAIDPVVFSPVFPNSLYAAQLTKDAIVDQFRTRCGARPSVDRDDPDLRINLHIGRDTATIYLDASGESLHKRGYRLATGEAPIGEVLAAGILRIAGWAPSTPLADFMCGSGTFLIEAALLARNIAPGTIRKEFGYIWWTDFDAALHRDLVAEARRARVDDLELALHGSDLDEQVLEAARQNAEAAGVDGDISFATDNFETARPREPSGMLITNPPYDERLKVAQAAGLYRRIGDALKQRWTGYTAYVLTGNLEAGKQIGLRPSARIPLYNGPIECRLLKFELYASPQSPPEPSPSLPREIDVEAPADESLDDDLDGRFNDERVDNESDDDVGDFDDEGEPSETSAAPLPRPSRRNWQDQAAEFRNRLTRMGKHWSKWARRQQITCFRLYDRDMPEVPLAIDWYDGHLVIAEYDRPHERTDIEQRIWLERMVATAAETLGVESNRVYFKQRRRRERYTQYERQSQDARTIVVEEAGHKFEINLSDYLDTGLFLDHRITRSLVAKEAAGKHVLNLFAYTGSFTVYAAAGGAASTVTVDLSNTYLDWAERNLRLNGLAAPEHQLFRDDAMSFLEHLGRRRLPPFDLVIVDPPTFSNSKKLQDIWDVQRDHAELLNRVIAHTAPGGKIYFSTNSRRFKLAEDELHDVTIREITRQTIPLDFRNKRIHRCWTLIRRE